MTNQQSIDRLLSLSLWLDKDSELYQAIVMAISALKAQEAKAQLSEEGTTPKVKKTCITCKHNSTSNKKWPCVDCDMREPADRWEPKELSKNSPKLDKENGDLQPTCNELAKDICVPCKDTISRAAAIDALHTWFRDGFDEDRWWNSTHVLAALEGLPSAQPEPCEDAVSREAAIDVAENAFVRGLLASPDIRKLPSVQPKRKKGKWIEIALSNHTYKCSVCGRLLVNITDGKNNVAKNYPFCHCGADMREDTDDKS